MRLNLNIKLKNDQHLPLIEALIDLTIDNFLYRYCNINDETGEVMLACRFGKLAENELFILCMGLFFTYI